MALRTLGKIKFSVTESKDTLCPLLYHSPSKSPVRTAQSYPYTMVLKLQETLRLSEAALLFRREEKGPTGLPDGLPGGLGPACLPRCTAGGRAGWRSNRAAAGHVHLYTWYLG